MEKTSAANCGMTDPFFFFGGGKVFLLEADAM